MDKVISEDKLKKAVEGVISWNQLGLENPSYWKGWAEKLRDEVEDYYSLDLEDDEAPYGPDVDDEVLDKMLDLFVSENYQII